MWGIRKCKAFNNKKKLKGNNLSITVNSIKLRMGKLTAAKTFWNIWTFDGKILYYADDASGIKPAVSYQECVCSWKSRKTCFSENIFVFYRGLLSLCDILENLSFNIALHAYKPGSFNIGRFVICYFYFITHGFSTALLHFSVKIYFIRTQKI